jgi:hypothetical protein
LERNGTSLIFGKRWFNFFISINFYMFICLYIYMLYDKNLLYVITNFYI